MEQSYENWARSNGRRVVTRPDSLNQKVDNFSNVAQEFKSSMPWLYAALGSFAISAGISALKSRKGLGKLVTFVGPALLLYGLYRQLVKQNPERMERGDLH